MRHLLCCLVLSTFAACATVNRPYVLKGLPPKEPDCRVEFFSAPPQRAFEEVATLQLSGWTSDRASYLEKLQPEVCQLGGDAALVPQLNVDAARGLATGTATVLKWR